MTSTLFCTDTVEFIKKFYLFTFYALYVSQTYKKGDFHVNARSFSVKCLNLNHIFKKKQLEVHLKSFNVITAVKTILKFLPKI
jgi:hypothetical protein